MESEGDYILPDVLSHGLRLVFCGTAAGRRSATEGAYYAHPGNFFWRSLHTVGLTPRLFAPPEFRRLLTLGIGLTDLAKRHSGNDDQLPGDAFDVDAFHEKITRFAPRVIAFTSKHAAQSALGYAVEYGLQVVKIGSSEVFVLPSPSGQARRFWNVDRWHDLARHIENADRP